VAGIKTDDPRSLEAVRLLFGTRGESSGYLKNMRALSSAGSAAYQSALDDFIRTFELIEALGVKCQIDMTAGKGFEYYTGLIFRVNAGDQNIGGGGRYDQLISVMGGQDAPAAGFALYMDRLMSLLPDEPKKNSRVEVACAPESFAAGARLVAELREAGYIAEIALGQASCASHRVEIGPGGDIMFIDISGARSACAGISEVKKRLGRP
jgi:histidyl-tRNA synthetase